MKNTYKVTSVGNKSIELIGGAPVGLKTLVTYTVDGIINVERNVACVLGGGIGAIKPRLAHEAASGLRKILPVKISSQVQRFVSLGLQGRKSAAAGKLATEINGIMVIFVVRFAV